MTLAVGAPVEEALAGWAAELDWDALPGRVRERTEDILLDALASALAGRTQALVAQVDAPARAFAGAGASTVIGAAPAAPAAAVFLNAYAITSATICDVYRPGLCHVAPVVLPPLLALAEERDAPGRELLAAFAVGLELTTRLCRALDYPSLRRRGWHSPGVVGPVGAAAAAARLLRLDPDRTTSALAHAAAQGAGTFAALGTEAVKFNQARGAVSGLLAALVAEGGLAASPRWLTDPDGGMAHSYSDGADPAAAARGLGDDWELERISLRGRPAASSVQSLIDVCLELVHDLGVRPGDVESIAVELAPGAYEVSGPRLWADPLSAQQSARWVAAAVLHDGDWWLEQSSAARIADPVAGAFARDRVAASASPELAGAAVRVHVRLAGGSELSLAREHAPGDPSLPLTREQIEEKARRAGKSASMDGIADELITLVGGLVHAESAAPLVRSLGGGAR